MGNESKTACVLCGAAAYCCGAVAPRAIAALLGRFLPRLGPLVHSSGPFFCLAGRDGEAPWGRARRRLLQRRVDAGELLVQGPAKAVHHGDDRKRNAGSDQTVFDRGGAGFVRDELREELLQVGLQVFVMHARLSGSARGNMRSTLEDRLKAKAKMSRSSPDRRYRVRPTV